MLVLWPLLLIGAALVMRKARGRPQRFAGSLMYAAWALAGGLFGFSLLAGLSIGVFLLPLAAFATLWAATNAPGREAIGFPIGAVAVGALVLLLV